MKRKIPWLALLTAVCGFTSLRADLTIVERFDVAGQKMDSTVLVKDGHVRFVYPPDVPSPTSRASAAVTSLIFDLKTGEWILLVSSMKNYVRAPMMHSPGMLKDGEKSLKPTGKKDTISGYAADEYTGAVSGRKMTLWLTRAIPDYGNIARQLSAAFAEGRIAATLKRMGMDMDMQPLPGGIPVRTIYETGSGQTVCTVLSISAEPIADSEFEIPADYKQIDNSPYPR